MADPNAAADVDPLAQIADIANEGATGGESPRADDPAAQIAQIAHEGQPPQSSAMGAFARGAERGALPAVGGIAGAGAGAEAGGALGLLGGPFAEVTAPVGAVVGGIAGGFLGASAVEKAQDWALSKLPDSWRDSIGMSEQQEKIDTGEYPKSTYMGGIAPYLLTMRPEALTAAAEKLRPNATALERILAHSLTGRLFGGALMGGMELGQEATSDEKVSWPKVAIATAFGIVLNRPTRIGKRITELGARPVRSLLGVPHPSPAAAPSPTLAEAADAKVMGAGITEPVFQGSEAQDPQAEQTARETAAAETAPIPPDIHAIARQMQPELFENYNVLTERERALSGWLAEVGPDEAPAAAQHLAATRAELDRIAPEITAANNRAAEFTGAPAVEPEGRFATMAEMLAARGEHPGATPENAPSGRTVDEQKVAIADDVSRQILAAGRPQEEAELSGRLWAERYAALSEQLNGAVSPEDLYRYQAGAEIRGPGRQGPPTPAAPATEAPPRTPTGAAELTPAALERTVAEATAQAAKRPIVETPMPTGANSSTNLDGPVYVDPRVPPELRKPVAVHETVEQQVEAQGVPYPKAHEIATQTEKEFVEASGVDWKKYTETWDGLLSKIEHEKVPADQLPQDLHVSPDEALGHHRNKAESLQSERNKAIYARAEGYAPLVAEFEKTGMIENAAAYKQAAKERREKYGGGTVRIQSAAQERRATGKSLSEDRAAHERTAAAFDEGVYKDGVTRDDIPEQVRDMAIEAMETRGLTDPVEALEWAETKFESDAHYYESLDDMLAAEHVIATEEGHDIFGEIPFETGGNAAQPGVAGEGGQGARPAAETGKPPPEAGRSAREQIIEYFQRRRRAAQRNLIAEREKEGQLGLPGTEPIGQGELAQRKANEPLKPSVEQKPMDVGLFGDNTQKELFQMRAPRAHGKDFYQIKAFHGSPYDFDKFDLSKIGTGEGAQAYGHGLYFAENPATAEAYKHSLSDLKDWPITGGDPDWRVPSWVGKTANASPGGLDEMISNFTDRVAHAKAENHWNAGGLQSIVDALTAVKEGKAQLQKPGKQYQVSIIADPEHFLDWDKPLSEQPHILAKIPQNTREDLENILDQGGYAADLPQFSGREAYQLFNKRNEDPGVATNELKNLGIPGIKYLDQGSRQTAGGELIDVSKGPQGWQSKIRMNRPNGEQYFTTSAPHPTEQAARDWAQQKIGNPGTRNYVLFDDKLIEITHKDGKPVPRAERDSIVRELYQRQADARSLLQGPQGRTTLAEGMRPIITLARTADASTFMHESAHVWLEELVHFSEHPAATPQLRADADAALQWMGVTKEGLHATYRTQTGRLMPTREARVAHEKFARGFERYLREGTAPSPQLASVFARFRDWLLRIYQVLKGESTARDLPTSKYKLPALSPQIRDVFDRMLASRPQRTVIAPERVVQPALPELHEVDAAHTEPPEAHAAGDRVVAESTQFRDNLPGGIHAEFAADEQRRIAAERAAAANARPEAPGGAVGTEPLPAPVAEPEPVAPGAARGAEPRAELHGGGQPVPEGAEVRGGRERPGQPGNADAVLGDKPLAPRPAEQLTEPDKLNLGKEGNIRAENITSVAQFMRAIDESSERIAAEKGSSDVLTMGEMTDLASDLAIDPASISEQELSGIFGGVKNIAAKVWALRKAVRDHAQAVHEASIKARDSQSDEDYATAVQAFLRQDMLQSVLSSVTSEIGRGLGMAFRNMEGWQKAKDINQHVKDATGLTLFQWKSRIALAAELKTPQQVAQFTRDMNQKNFGRLVLEYWINGLISGPVTHITYMIGNELLALEKAGPETAMAAAIGAARKALGRQGESVRFGEIAEQLRSHVGAIPAGLKAAIDALRTGVTTQLPGEGEQAQNILRFPGTEYASPAMLDEAARYGDVMQSLFALGRGIKDGLIAGGELTRAQAPGASWRYSPSGAIPDLQLRGFGTVPIGTAVRLPSRMIAAVHSFFRAVNYSMEKNRLAYRAAADEGLTGTQFEERLGELRQRPTDAIMQQAAATSTELTLMGQGGVFTQRLSALMNTPFFASRDARGKIVPGSGIPLLKFIDPFVHISANIIDQAVIQRTPLGILSPELRRDLLGHNGNVAQDTAQARMLMGTVYALGFGYLAAQGLVTGSQPSDPKQAAIWRLSHQAHSVRIGDMWYDMHRLGPLGMLMGIAADLYDVANDLSQEDVVTAASHLQHAITQNILDESFMRGPADLIQAIEDPARYGQAYIRSQLTTFVPYSVGLGQVARMADPYTRQARTVMDQLRRGIPGLSQQLMPRRDIWGEEIPHGALGNVTAIYEQKVNHDPVNQAMLQLGIYPGTLERKIRNEPLTDQQYDDFQRIAGRMTKMRLDAIVNSPDFRYWPNHLRRNVIEHTIAANREVARGVMFKKYPQIPAQATQLRKDRLTKD